MSQLIGLKKSWTQRKLVFSDIDSKKKKFDLCFGLETRAKGKTKLFILLFIYYFSFAKLGFTRTHKKKKNIFQVLVSFPFDLGQGCHCFAIFLFNGGKEISVSLVLCSGIRTLRGSIASRVDFTFALRNQEGFSSFLFRKLLVFVSQLFFFSKYYLVLGFRQFLLRRPLGFSFQRRGKDLGFPLVQIS